jgi:hypothetical protein
MTSVPTLAVVTSVPALTTLTTLTTFPLLTAPDANIPVGHETTLVQYGAKDKKRSSVAAGSHAQCRDRSPGQHGGGGPLAHPLARSA